MLVVISHLKSSVNRPCFPFEGGSWTLALVAGVLAGCGGMFLPGDRGLSPLSKAAPWALQSALYGSAFYYFADTSTLPGGVKNQVCHFGFRIPMRSIHLRWSP